MHSFGKNSLIETEVFAIHSASLSEALPQISLPTKYFTALIACDSEQLSDQEIRNFAESLLAKGAVYICVWGKDCERFHDIIDGVAIEMEVLGKTCPGERGGVLMTTWHENDPLNEALWYLLSCAWPTDDELNSCSTIVITVGNQSWANEVDSHLKDIEKFHKEMCDPD